MRNLPTSTITLLFTDIEGSTRLLTRLGERYADMLAEYRHLLRGVFEHWHGHEVDTQGDAFFVAFARAAEAISAAVEAQRALAAHAWPEGKEVRVRMGLHTGEPSLVTEGYTGVDVHQAARIMSAGHGGQVLLSQATRELVEHTLPDDVALRDMGEHRLKDLQRPSHLFQLVIAGQPSDFPPLKTLSTHPNNLPVQPTLFIGREKEVAAVGQLLRREEMHLVTLTGPGGTGKTRLALQVAAELSDFFADGIYFVDLAPMYWLSGSDLAQAHTLLDESFALSREVGDKESIANCFYLSGMLTLSEGDAASARSLTEHALALFKEMKLQPGTARSLYALAEVATVGGDYATSQALYEQGVGVARESGDKRTITPGLEGLAAVVAAQGNHARAAHLWGAAEALCEVIGAPLPLVERAPYNRAVAASRTRLGEQAFATAWAEGQTMTLEQVLAVQGQVVLPAPTQGERSSSPTTASPPPYPDGLMAREVEVLRVVAQSLTNEQVAERLVISPRTVDTHLTSIYGKIGVSSRSAATRYAIEHHLVRPPL